MTHQNDIRDRLVQRKRELLKEQKLAGEEFYQLLNQKGTTSKDEDGVIEDSRKTRKNLAAAIAQSRQAGYFSYHEKSKKTVEIEKSNILKTLTNRIARIEKEIILVNGELETLDREHQLAITDHQPPQILGLNEWFATYGRPNDNNQKGWKTEFVPSSKVYGGTRHHKAFKTLAVTLKRGRMTR